MARVQIRRSVEAIDFGNRRLLYIRMPEHQAIAVRNLRKVFGDTVAALETA